MTQSSEKLTENDTSPAGRKNKSRVRLQLVLLALVFLSPWCFALLWKSSNRINHGTLLDPIRPLAAVELEVVDGVDANSVASTDTEKAQDLRGKWHWVVLADGTCTDACVARLDLIRQVRLAQGKHARRLSYFLAVTDPTTDDIKQLLSSSLNEAHPNLVVRVAKKDNHAVFLDQFRDEESASAAIRYDAIFVVDPLGNLIMVYDGLPEPSHLREDMARLLKASHVG